MVILATGKGLNFSPIIHRQGKNFSNKKRVSVMKEKTLNTIEVEDECHQFLIRFM
jgi:hypothetical protein